MDYKFTPIYDFYKISKHKLFPWDVVLCTCKFFTPVFSIYFSPKLSQTYSILYPNLYCLYKYITPLWIPVHSSYKGWVKF